jgi:hypothetical protein
LQPIFQPPFMASFGIGKKPEQALEKTEKPQKKTQQQQRGGLARGNVPEPLHG